jgi:hypothetical protein
MEGLIPRNLMQREASRQMRPGVCRQVRHLRRRRGSWGVHIGTLWVLIGRRQLKSRRWFLYSPLEIAMPLMGLNNRPRFQVIDGLGIFHPTFMPHVPRLKTNFATKRIQTTLHQIAHYTATGATDPRKRRVNITLAGILI